MYLIYKNKSLLGFRISTYSYGLLLMIMLYGCVEPYEGTIADFDDVLVINSILTNENKRHEVLLTRSYRFEDDGPSVEKNAEVEVLSGDGVQFMFEEIEPGKYLSIESFAAEANKSYSLSITTEDGKHYASSTMKLPVATTKIDNLYAERIVKTDGTEGMGIFIDSFDPLGESNYYRYEYEESFKIIAPFWSPYDAVFVIEGYTSYNIPVILREQEERVCYGTSLSNNINIQSTLGLSEDRLSRFNIRFIERDNYILSYRYSILVKQYVQNPEAFSYYETLNGLSQNSENIFSEDQPGFLGGNIFSIDDGNENVAGFFEVATVTEKRLFFSYEDFFPGEELPPYKIECNLLAPSSRGSLGTRLLINYIKEESLRFYDFNRNPGPNEGEFLMVFPECGDCTTLGSNVVPDYWIE